MQGIQRRISDLFFVEIEQICIFSAQSEIFDYTMDKIECV